MKKWQYAFTWILLCAVLFGSAISPAYAQGSQVSVSLDDLGYQAITLRGMYGANDVWAPFASNWLIETDATMDIVYKASPLLNETRSTLTIMVNDLEVASLHPIADGQAHRTTVSIPLARLQGKGVSIRFQAYLRLTDVPCEETNNPGQWLTILPETAINLTLTERVTSPDLSDLSASLSFQGAVGTPPAVLFILPDDPDADLLRIAGLAAGRLAQSAGVTDASVQVTTVSDLSQKALRESNLVLLGTPEQNLMIGELGSALPVNLQDNVFYTQDDQPAPAEDALLAVGVSPWNAGRSFVLISANGQEGLRKAGDVFADDRAFQSLRGAYAFVHTWPETDVVSLPGRPWLGEQTSFAQLGDRDRTISGTGQFKEYFFFHRPPGWLLDKGAQLTLNLAFSPVLRAQESYISVFINDAFVGAMRTGDMVGENQVTFDLPVADLNKSTDGSVPQLLTVRIEVGNYLAETNCEQTHPEAAWTRIYATSFFTTPHVYITQPDLQAFPYPFVSDANVAPAAVVLPPQPTSRELALGLRLVVAMETNAPLAPHVELVTADQVDAANYGDYHLVILGTRERQPLLNEFLNVLGAVPGYKGERGLYQALDTPYEGLLREAPSPWNDQRVVLLAFSESEFGFENAVTALTLKPPVVSQSGSVAVVRADGSTQVIYQGVDASPGLEPGRVVREPVLPKPATWQVIALILITGVLAVILTIWLAMRRKR